MPHFAAGSWTFAALAPPSPCTLRRLRRWAPALSPGSGPGAAAQPSQTPPGESRARRGGLLADQALRALAEAGCANRGSFRRGHSYAQPLAQWAPLAHGQHPRGRAGPFALAAAPTARCAPPLDAPFPSAAPPTPHGGLDACPSLPARSGGAGGAALRAWGHFGPGFVEFGSRSMELHVTVRPPQEAAATDQSLVYVIYLQ